jgi:hypothetical protein
METMRILYSIFIIIIIFCSVSCARDSIPPEADAREFFENQWKNELENETIRIIRFDKIKGERKVIKNKIVFKKKMRGWKAPDGKFY